jgi:hypothetical protein
MVSMATAVEESMVITDWFTAQGIAVDRTVRRPWTVFALAGLHTARAKSITNQRYVWLTGLK